MNPKFLCSLMFVFAVGGLVAQTVAPVPAPAQAVPTGTEATNTSVLPVLATTEKASPRTFSTLETLYNTMGSFPQPLLQYGYDATKAGDPVVQPGTTAPSAPPSQPAQTPQPSLGNVSPLYQLGAGDQVSIMVWGDPVDLAELSPLVSSEVNRSGGLFFPPVGLIPAAGLTLQDVERALSAGLAKKYKRFELRLAVTQLRQFPMVVTGYVNKPGQVAVTAGFGIFEILKAAGGVTPSGSLRTLELRSRGGNLRVIDLYEALMEGKVPELSLKEGDSLFVPALGKTAAVGGAVQRPGIYETLPRDTLANLVRFGGGQLPDVRDSTFRLSSIVNGRVSVVQGNLGDSLSSGRLSENGDLLELFRGGLDVVDGVLVEGQVLSPGWFPLPQSRKLSSLLAQVGIKSDTDLTQGQLIRTNPQTFEAELQGFSPREVMDGKGDLPLLPRDRVRFFESRALLAVPVGGEVVTPAVVPWKEGLTLEQVLGQVTLKGEVRSLVAQVRDKDTSKDYYLVDRLTRRSAAQVLIPQGASVQIVRVPDSFSLQTVVISGELGAPGVYRIEKGMRISDLLAKAGGLNERAFLPGLSFLRASVLEGQRSQVNSVTKTLQDEINALEAEVLAATDPLAKATATAKLAAKKDALALLISGLEETLGRISLNAPATLQAFAASPANIELEAGDRLYIPAVPNFVSVLGSVYSQSTQAYVPGKTVGDALSLSGGVTPSGDLGRAYLVRSSGLIEGTERYQLFLVNTFQSVTLMPGDVVVVPPRDLNTVDGWTLTKEILQILANTVGLTANSLAIMRTLGVL